MTGVNVTIEGLDGVFAGADAKMARYAAMALNRVAKSARADMAREVRRQVNLPASYVSPAGGRLVAVPSATPTHLQSAVRARSRPTSLARYVTSSRRGKGGGVNVQVAPGRVKFMRGAFLMKLRQGTVLTDTKHNLGLAIRLRPGQPIRNKKFFKAIGGGLALLYGPSVQQAIIANAGTGIAKDMSEKFLRDLEREFSRLVSVKGIL